MEVAGRFLGVSEEGSPLVGVLVQGSGRSVVKWFAPTAGQLAGEWARCFVQGQPVVCSLVLDEHGQRMLIEDMRAQAG